MRTTLTLDDDLAQLLEREAKTKGLSFKEIVNTTLRRGVIELTRGNSENIQKVVTRPHCFGTKPGLDWDRLNQLSDELEVEELQKKNHF